MPSLGSKAAISFLFFLSISPFPEWYRVSYKNSFDYIPAAELESEKFSRLSPLVWWCPFPAFTCTSKFSFLGAFLFFFYLVVRFFPLFFSFLIISMEPFSMPNSISLSCQYIRIVCIWVFFSFIFCKQFDVVHLRKVVNLWCNTIATSQRG